MRRGTDGNGTDEPREPIPDTGGIGGTGSEGTPGGYEGIPIGLESEESGGSRESGSGEEQPRPRRKRRTRAEIEAEEASRPLSVSFDPNVPEARRRGRRAAGIPPETITSLLMFGFAVYGQSRPAPFNQAWEFSAKELDTLSSPLSRVISRLPAKYLAMAETSADPILCLMALWALVQEGQNRERQILVAIKQANPQSNHGTPAGNGTGPTLRVETANSEPNSAGPAVERADVGKDLPFADV